MKNDWIRLKNESLYLNLFSSAPGTAAYILAHNAVVEHAWRHGPYIAYDTLIWPIMTAGTRSIHYRQGYTDVEVKMAQKLWAEKGVQ